MLFKFAQDIEISPGNYIYGGNKRNDNLAQKSVGKSLLVDPLFQFVTPFKKKQDRNSNR